MSIRAGCIVCGRRSFLWPTRQPMILLDAYKGGTRAILRKRLLREQSEALKRIGCSER